MFVPPYRVSLSGGGIKGFAHIGALEVLESRGHLKSVREYMGISAGALCAMCICIGCTLSEFRHVVTALDFGTIRDIDPETILNFPDTYGMDTGANLERLIRIILKGKGLDPKITFKELEAMRTGPSLRVIATNMNTCTAQEFSASLSPDIEIRFAVQASMAVPIYFTPLKHPKTGHLFVDGGIMNSSPFRHISYEERLHTLSIGFAESHKPIEEIKTMYDFIYQLYYSIDYFNNITFNASWPTNIILIDCGRINTVNFEADIDIKNRIIDSGRRAAEAFLKSPGQRPVRRFSVA